MENTNNANTSKAYYDTSTGKIIVPKKSERTTAKKAVVYLRVSDTKQVTHGHGLDGQLAACERYCKAHKLSMIEVFKDEALTGKVIGREGLEQAVEYIEEKNKQGVEIHYLVVSELSRVSRAYDSLETQLLERRVSNTGCIIISQKFEPKEKMDEQDIFMKDLDYLLAKQESMRISRRTVDGYKGRMNLGCRPCPAPVGYGRETRTIGGVEVSYLIPVYPQADIIKEGLEMFANDELVSKRDLLKYFNEHKLKSNSRSANPGKLYDEFIKRLLEPNKLLLLAGYIIYPKYEIYEPIEAKHDALISVATAHKILDKVANNAKPRKQNRADKSPLYPLRNYLYCPDCDMGFTAYGTFGKLKTTVYHYYSLNQRSLQKEDRRNHRVDKVHEQFRELLTRMTPNAEVFKLLKSTLEETISAKEKLHMTQHNRKKSRLKTIENGIKTIKKQLGKVTKTAAIEELENDWMMLLEEKKLLENDTTKSLVDDKEFQTLYEQFIQIIERPLAIWDLGNTEMRHLLIGILFGYKLYYTKNEEFQTPHKSLIYSILDDSDTNVERMGRTTGLEPATSGTTNQGSTNGATSAIV